MLADDLRPVIHIKAIADTTGVPEARARRGGPEPLAVPVSDPRKSADFYRRVFGLWPRSRRDALVLAAPGSPALELRLEPRGATASPAATQRCTFVVADLDAVREQVWNLGVKIARDSGEPDHIFRRRGGASLYVHDPDGNEIELVELRHDTERAAARLDARRRLRIPCTSERPRVSAG